MAQETQEHQINKLLIKSKVTGNSIDLTQICEKIVLKESIFKSSIMGELYITDTSSLIESLPIVGQEEIEIIFGYPDHSKNKDGTPDIEIEGIVYKVDNRERTGYGASIENYVIYFCDSVETVNKLKRVSKTFKEKKISEYVSTISNDDLEIEVDCEQTEGEKTITIPNLNPLSAIDFLANFSHNNQGKNNMFFFYQGRDKFYFKSIEKMIEEKNNNGVEIYFSKFPNYFDIDHPIQKYIQHISNQSSGDETEDVSDIIRESRESEEFQSLSKQQQKKISERVSESKVISIQDFVAMATVEFFDMYQAEYYQFKESFDNFNQAELGYFGFTNYAHDSLTKSFHKVEYNYSDNFQDLSNLNGNDIKTKEYEISQNPINTRIYCRNTDAGKLNSKYIKDKMKNQSLMTNHYDEERKPLKNTKKSRIFKGHKFYVRLPAISKLKLGDVVKVKFPSFKVQNEKMRERKYPDDKYYSGNYLVLEITHTILKLNTWNTELFLVSDSLSDKIG